MKNTRRDPYANSGWVNFPINDNQYTNSKEGGLFVRLVVIDNKPYDNKWMICCGGLQHVFMDESYVGNDKVAQPRDRLWDWVFSPKTVGRIARIVNRLLSSRVKSWMISRYYRIVNSFDEREFPRINKEDDFSDRYMSRGYLAILTLGSTGWSGWDNKKEEYWHCKYSNLTSEGKELYNMIQKLYVGCELELQTWLDT